MAQLRLGFYLAWSDQKTNLCVQYAAIVLFCFVLFSLQLSVCLWWHDYRRDDLAWRRLKGASLVMPAEKSQSAELPAQRFL